MQEQSSRLLAIDQYGARGTLDLSEIPPEGSDSRLILVRLDDGSSVFADASLFVEQEPGIFFFPGSFVGLRHNAESSQATTVQTSGQAANAADRNYLIVPILAEQMRIARQQIVTGGVRVHKTVHERVETVDEPIFAEELDVERVPVNRFVAEPPSVRYEGDVMIVPLLEEVMVVEKRLVLREEIHVRKRRETVRKPQQVVLRREEVRLEEIEPDEERRN